MIKRALLNYPIGKNHGSADNHKFQLRSLTWTVCMTGNERGDWLYRDYLYVAK
jgi:hypothetical protein